MNKEVLPSALYVMPREVEQPSFITAPRWFPRFYSLTCGRCNQRVVGLGWWGRIRCRCSAINVPQWFSTGF